MTWDFEVDRHVEVANEDELSDVLRLGGRMRLAGTGTAQSRVPAPDGAVTLVGLAPMDRILRLEPDDLTCSVQPGVRRADLDLALAEHGLRLPCEGGGTVGGLFATDEFGPGAPGQPGARGILLGVRGVLAEGLAFRSGARVVKNVAGFDLQKLFVGSRGRLFAATELHLKLRPQPRAHCEFRSRALDFAEAWQLGRRLRNHGSPPLRVALWSIDDAWAVTGELGGRAEEVRATLRGFELEEGTVDPRDDHAEVVSGLLPYAQLPLLRSHLPAHAVACHQGERLRIGCMDAAASDDVLHAIKSLGGAGEIVEGPAARRGRTSGIDECHARLSEEIRIAFDPEGRLQ